MLGPGRGARSVPRPRAGRRSGITVLLAVALALGGCGCAGTPAGERDEPAEVPVADAGPEPVSVELPELEGDLTVLGRAVLLARLDLVEDMRPEFDHGPKDAGHQRYIVLHDTEGVGSPESVVSWWSSSGNLVAAHFVVGTDGHIVQCVPLDRIAHHAGYGDTGHNELFGITEDGRDDMLGSVPIGASFADYGMNAWSVGIELVHVGGSGDYPEAQLEALDGLIAYIDAYYGFESQITDHKAWRSGNSDTSAEFAGYLANYQDHRTHD